MKIKAIHVSSLNKKNKETFLTCMTGFPIHHELRFIGVSSPHPSKLIHRFSHLGSAYKFSWTAFEGLVGWNFPTTGKKLWANTPPAPYVTEIYANITMHRNTTEVRTAYSLTYESNSIK